MSQGRRPRLGTTAIRVEQVPDRLRRGRRHAGERTARQAQHRSLRGGFSLLQDAAAWNSVEIRRGQSRSAAERFIAAGRDPGAGHSPAKDLGTDKVRIFFLVSAAGSASRTAFSSMALGCTSYLSPRISSARLRDCDSDARTTFTGPPLELQELRASPPGMLSR